MRYAPFIKKGDKVGFVAPAFGCNIEPYHSAFLNAQNQIKQRGMEILLGPNCYEGKGIGISNTPKLCGEEFMEFYCNSDTQALMSCGGGELMCEILAHVDFEKLKTAPAKWFMGYSDNTNLIFLLATICDTAAIYGPCAPAFGMEPWHPALEDAWKVMMGEKLVMTPYDSWEKESLKNEESPLEPYNCTEPNVIRAYMPGEEAPWEIDVKDSCSTECGVVSADDESCQKGDEEAVVMKGRLLGGCMDCLVNLLGTKYDRVKAFNERYSEDGVIWYLEACDLNVMSIRRAIWQMENAGWFEKTKGFLIGRPLCHGENLMGLDQYHAVIDLLSHYQVPIVMDLDIGHIAPMMPIVCGSMGEVSVSPNGFQLDMKLT